MARHIVSGVVLVSFHRARIEAETEQDVINKIEERIAKGHPFSSHATYVDIQDWDKEKDG